MNNFVSSGDYIGCRVKHTNKRIYLEVQNFLAVFIDSNTINSFEVLYTNNKNRYSVRINFKNQTSSVLELNKYLFQMLISSLAS